MSQCVSVDVQSRAVVFVKCVEILRTHIGKCMCFSERMCVYTHVYDMHVRLCAQHVSSFVCISSTS